MKYTGFIKNYHPDIENLNDFDGLDFGYEYFDKNQLIDYLEGGNKIAVSMHIIKSLFSSDKKIIGGLIYFTDGEWIWTNYLIYYLKFYNIKIDFEFIDYIRTQKYIQEKININSLKKAVNELDDFLKQ